MYNYYEIGELANYAEEKIATRYTLTDGLSNAIGRCPISKTEICAFYLYSTLDHNNYLYIEGTNDGYVRIIREEKNFLGTLTFVQKATILEGSISSAKEIILTYIDLYVACDIKHV